MDISVIILTKNEAEMIGGCIESVKLLDPKEIIVIDDGSTDKTQEITQKMGAKVIRHKKKDFAEARNFGLKKSSSEWILYIDADERLSKELVYEIKRVVGAKADISAFKITRVNYYLGKRWPKTEELLRLFMRRKLHKWTGKVHESPQVSGSIVQLESPLLHHTHRNLNEMIENTLVWSGIEAKLRFKAGHPPVVWWRLPRVMLPVFFDYYIRQGGWKVGTIGLIESMYQAFSVFFTYARLWELQQSDLTPSNEGNDSLV